MTLPVVWLPEAFTELGEAMAHSHYENIRPELANRFAAAVDEAIEHIAEGPLRYALVDREKRRAAIRKFPYGVFFLVEPSRIVVIACFHGRRNPTHWQTR